MLKTYDVPEIVSPVVPKVEPRSGNISQSRRKALQKSIPYNDHITFDPYDLNVDKNYHAYLVRFKRREAQSSWCATLEDVHTRETLRFATERDLLVYLLQLLAAEPASPNDHPNPEVESDR